MYIALKVTALMDKIYKAPAPNLLFGQFLIEKNIIDEPTLVSALKIQVKEKDSTIKQSHRLLGQILLEEFKVFENRLELNDIIHQFNEYRQWIEKQHAMLKEM